MCTVSMVYDWWNRKVPEPFMPWQPVLQPNTNPLPQIWITPQGDYITLEQAKQLIKDFWDSVEAAKVVDKLTNQPDCEDPEKAKLEQRVKQLERQIISLKKKVNRSNKSKRKNV